MLCVGCACLFYEIVHGVGKNLRNLPTCHLTQLAGPNQLPVRSGVDTFVDMCQRPLACCSDSHTTLLSRVTNIPTLSTGGLHLPEPSAASVSYISPRNGHRAFNYLTSLLHTCCTP